MRNQSQYLEDIVANPSHGYLLSSNSAETVLNFADGLARRLVEARSQGDIVKNITKLDSGDASSITTKQINDLLAQTKLAQTHTNHVFMIVDAEKLSLAASNSLLKSLEEPGKNIIFLLTTTRPQALQLTVRSRLQHITVSQDSSQLDEIVSKVDSQTAQIIRTVSFGDAVLAEELLENTDQLHEDVKLIKSLLAGDYYERVTLLKSYWKDKIALLELINKMLAIARSALHASKSNNTKAFQWADKVEVCLRAKERLEKNVSPRTVIMELMIQL